jgi:hypothetical protein
MKTSTAVENQLAHPRIAVGAHHREIGRTPINKRPPSLVAILSAVRVSDGLFDTARIATNRFAGAAKLHKKPTRSRASRIIGSTAAADFALPRNNVLYGSPTGVQTLGNDGHDFLHRSCSSHAKVGLQGFPLCEAPHSGNDFLRSGFSAGRLNIAVVERRND